MTVRQPLPQPGGSYTPFAGSRASPTRFFLWEQPGGWRWGKIGHTYLFPYEAATFNYLMYLGSSFIKSILISSYLVELASSSLGPCTEYRSYKHLELATLTTHSSTASAFKMNENQSNVAWFQDFRNEGWKRPVGLVLKPYIFVEHGFLCHWLRYFGPINFKCPEWQTPALILEDESRK